MMTKVLNILRILLGLLFIVSGLLKANDPLGLSYKMEEFFGAWHMFFMQPFLLVFSVIIISVEVLLGVALVVGWLPRIFTRFTFLLNLFFLFLTGYAMFSGKIKTCGCLGDCWDIPAKASFLKDIILTVWSALLVIFYGRLTPLFNLRLGARCSIGGMILSVLICVFTLHYLPFMDCLPFHKGAHIQKAIQDVAQVQTQEVWFIYTREGKEFSFKATELPSDLDHYTFVKRQERETSTLSTAQWTLKDFHLLDETNKERTAQLLSLPQCRFLFLREWNGSVTEDLRNELLTLFQENTSAPLFVVVKTELATLQQLLTNTGIEVLYCDNTLMKTLARAKRTYYLFESGSIIEKRAL